ncbi:MAG: hypothetical protein WBJ00_02675 [Dethiobacteria bacterium]|jgi:hypothetical protein|nr:hypothetical protein [Bacillota bacterium]HPT33613.1 hypothetical protein [Bacillota bacterium]HPZ64414.1 hypothetical protein [Bacillota bacterium]
MSVKKNQKSGRLTPAHYYNGIADFSGLVELADAPRAQFYSRYDFFSAKTK